MDQQAATHQLTTVSCVQRVRRRTHVRSLITLADEHFEEDPRQALNTDKCEKTYERTLLI